MLVTISQRSNMSPTYLIPNIHHQHRCIRFSNSSRENITTKSGYTVTIFKGIQSRKSKKITSGMALNYDSIRLEFQCTRGLYPAGKVILMVLNGSREIRDYLPSRFLFKTNYYFAIKHLISKLFTMNVLIAQCTYQPVLLTDTSAHSPVVRILNTDRDFLIVDIPIFLAGTSILQVM